MADGGSIAFGLAAGLLWISASLLALSLLTSTLSALIERSGPIRLRHWTEEAEGRLRRLYERPARFEAFRLLLSALAKLSPVALLCSLAGWLGEAGLVHASEPAVVWAAVLLVPVIAANEIGNRFLVAWDPEQALERLTPIYRLLALLLAPFVAVAVLLFPEDAARRRAEQDEEEATEDEIEAFIDVGTREGHPGAGRGGDGLGDRRLRRHRGAQRDDATDRRLVRAGRHRPRRAGGALRRVRALAPPPLRDLAGPHRRHPPHPRPAPRPANGRAGRTGRRRGRPPDRWPTRRSSCPRPSPSASS